MSSNTSPSTKLFISTPCYDAMMTMQYTTSILNLVTFLNQYKIDFVIDFTGNESLIPRARNHALGKFMDSDCTHLFFIDADIEFKPQAVMDLILYNKDVACGSYPKKTYNWSRFMHSMQNEQNSKESLDSRGLDFAYNAMCDSDNKVIQDDNKKFIRAKHASTGFMMIQRNIVEKLYKKHTELEIITDNLTKKNTLICGLFCCMIKDKQYLSEDYSFCERVNEIGGEVWINYNHNLNHIGKHIFRSDITNRNFLGRTTAEKEFYK